MTRITTVVIAALGLLGMAAPAHAIDVSGVWLTNTGAAQIRMAKCGANMCGTIIWLREPEKNGRPVTDEKNPDPAKRGSPMIGTQVAIGFHPSRDDAQKFVGTFYNAEDGKTYEGSIAQPNANQLHVTGCVLVFCQTQIWTRVK